MNPSPFSLDHKFLPDNPFELLTNWIEIKKSLNTDHYYFANASLATIDENGYPDSRVMTLKEFHDDHILFTTPLSQVGKAAQLDEIPKAALNFYWADVDIQIRMKGDTQKISETDADKIFATREKWLQVMSHSWNQSEVIQDWEEARESREKVEEKYLDKLIPRPPTWGGYRFFPHTIEFWLSNTRIRYRLTNGIWSREKLFP